MLFIYNNDFTLEGYYTFFYFLVFVAFSEEFLYRGYLFNKIDQEYGFWISVIISGLFFGIGHAMLPTIMQGESLSFFITQAMSNILGQGIFSSLLFP
ncbi:CPBP family intramembrane glutamic endopeptidase [uncultured Enterococcus sp.]|uniref:CPBP family intramembrane glutamic endopeptidase n=1 Tax=uncultured Enterococcus sp. TaxID=167972 RepID=UPI0037491D3F